MKKRCAAFVVCLLLVLITAQAGAEAITMTPTFYNPANDIADWHLDRRDISDALIQELRGGSFWANLLPVDEDLLLWYGTFEYHDLVQEESFWLSYDVEMPRSDAYAVGVDGEGNRLWSLRLSDPQSSNGFERAWVLADGRIMLKFNDQVGEFGSQYYIVSRQGEVQEMLPAYRAKAYGEAVYERLMPMHDGFFGGGSGFEDGAYGWMFGGANFTFFDNALNMQWRNASEIYRNGFMEARQTPDGILLGGSIWPDYIPDQPYLNQALRSVPIATKLDLDGNTVWTYMGHERSVGSASAIHGTEDGGAIFLTVYDPTVPTAYATPETLTLVKLDAKGAIEWVRTIEEHPVYIASGFVPYGEGYLIATCSSEEDGEVTSVLYVSREGKLIDVACLDKGQSDAAYFHVYVSLVTAPDGGAYLHGNAVETESLYAGIDNPQLCKPFYVNMQDVFPLMR